MNYEVRGALNRCQADFPLRRWLTLHEWLAEHREDVALLVADRGVTITADLLGMARGSLVNWAEAEGLEVKGVGKLASEMRELLGTLPHQPPGPNTGAGQSLSGETL